MNIDKFMVRCLIVPQVGCQAGFKTLEWKNVYGSNTGGVIAVALLNEHSRLEW